MIEREDLIEAIQLLDDPEELIADLVMEFELALGTGDFSGLEEVLAGIEEMVEIQDTQMIVKSWREFYGEGDDGSA